MASVSEASKRCIIWFGRAQADDRSQLAAAGWQLREVASLDQAMGIGLRGNDLVVALIDLRQDIPTGVELLERLLDEHGHLPCMALTPSAPQPLSAHTERLLARCQARFAAPLAMTQLLHCLRERSGELPAARGGLDALLGESPLMLSTRTTVRKFAPVDLPVLLTGETGTGKEVAAHALHALSPRHAHPFLAVNCGAISSTLLQSELFGHERGAFTGANTRRLGLFESAQGGTVFLDEIGDLPLEAQTNLLRVLQEGTIERVGSNQTISVDVRVIAATHVDLEQAVAQGRFRNDLYYRLNVLRLSLPPLRERGSDIELLARHFLQDMRSRHSTRARGFSRDALQAMAEFSWPGNVRELFNRVQRAAIVAEGELIGRQELELAPPALLRADGEGMLQVARIQAEREALLHCLRQHDFNISACARRMQVSRVTIYRLCRKHQVELVAGR